MKKSQLVEKLKRTIRMSAARGEGGGSNKTSDQRLDMLVEDILETLAQNKMKPPKWMQQQPMRMADGSTRLRDVRWRYTWEPEHSEAERPAGWPNPLLDGPGEQNEYIEHNEEE